MSQKCSTCRQPEPKENPECSLVKEGKTSATEYLERKVSTVQYLLERLDKKKQDQKIEPEDPFATSFCVLCHRNPVLAVNVPICKCEFVDDIKEELH